MSANTLDGRAGNERHAEQPVEADAGVLNQAIGEIDGQAAFQLRDGHSRPLRKRLTEKSEEPTGVAGAERREIFGVPRNICE